MSKPEDWARGYARQADADLRGWELFQKHPSAVAEECHKLLFLQMACEKLCKAHVLRAGIQKPEDVQTSHGFVAKHLPRIMKYEIEISKEFPRNLRWALERIRHLSGEIELLNPSMDRAKRRPDNCEYPWEAGGKILSPLDHQFTPTQLLTAEYGRTFLRLLRRAINRNL